MGDLISRSALLAAYDKAHEGPPGAARELIETAPDAGAHEAWECMFQAQHGTIMLCALRYVVGRQTYMPMLVRDYIKANKADINMNIADAMIMCIQEKDIVVYDTLPDGSTETIYGLGNLFERSKWLQFKEWLEELKEQRRKEEGHD